MFERESVIIKDASKLSFDYVPKVLVGREAEMTKLSMIFRPVIENGVSDTAFLTGSVGTGKTATMKRFIADMLEHAAKNNVPMDNIIVNCRQRSTESGVLYQCLRHYDNGFPDRGFSPSEMLRALKGHIERSKKRVIIVLDEANVLFQKGAGDIVYQLSRFNEESINRTFSVSLILISQEYVMDRLDDASLSSFKRANTIRFRKYTRNQLRDIIASRAEEALAQDAINEDALDLIADISAELGDARFAIDMLDKAARFAENRTEGIVNAEDVRSVNEMVFSVVNEPKLEELGRNELITLLAIARAIKTDTYVSTSAVEKTYAIVCEEYDTEPRKHTQFWTYVQNLEKQNLITVTVKPDPVGGRTAYISLPDIPSKVLAKKVEAVMEER